MDQKISPYVFPGLPGLIDIIRARIAYHGGRHHVANCIEAEAARAPFRAPVDAKRKPYRCKWRNYEINYLLKYHRCSKQRDIALRLNRTLIAVRQKLCYLKKDNYI